MTHLSRSTATAVCVFGLAMPLATAGTTLADPTRPPEASTSVAVGQPNVPPEVSPDRQDEWDSRERNLDEGATLVGAVGLLRTRHAELQAPGQFRVGFAGQWYEAGFLCTSSNPCSTRGAPSITSDSLNHLGGTLLVGASIVQLGPGTLDAVLSIEGYGNSDSANRPSPLQVLGDSNLGVSYAARLARVLSLGGFTGLRFIGSASGPDGAGTSATAGGMLTVDLRSVATRLPVRASVNVGYTFDNTADALASAEAQQGRSVGVARQPVTRIDRYGLGVNRVDHVDLALGAEALLVSERVRPFVEATVLIPVNRQGYACVLNNTNGDGCLASTFVAPSTLTLGGRFFPYKHGFSIMAALGIGIAGTSTFVEELQPVAPWTLYLGAGWAADVHDRPPVVRQVERVVERSPPAVHVIGFVHAKDSNEAIAGAVVSYRDRNDLWPLSTGADGRFGGDVAPGTYAYVVKADGFQPGTCEVNATAPDAQANVDCPLEELPRLGSVVVHLTDASSKLPIAGVQGSLLDAKQGELRQTADPSGALRFDGVAPGRGTFRVLADGYLAFVMPFDVKTRQNTDLDAPLRATPKQAKARLSGKQITLSQPVQFATDGPVILPSSFDELAEVADVLVRNPDIKKLEVQGHTDSGGTPEGNLRMSSERAEAVRAWLIDRGVEGERLSARGYGQERPLVANVTATNRARNRRIEFSILERAGPAPTDATAPLSTSSRAP